MRKGNWARVAIRLLLSAAAVATFALASSAAWPKSP
jgi:hypothetical protein